MFTSRYLKVLNPETFPPKILKAINENPSIKRFIDAGTPQNIFEKFFDYFKKDEFLDVCFHSEKIDEYNPYNVQGIIKFSFGKGVSRERSFKLNAFQIGRRREEGSIPLEGEDKNYKPPVVTLDDKLSKQISDIVDIDKLLK
jgi:hypothetical protein